MKKDIRWIQRLENYKKVLSNLSEGIKIAEAREINNLEKQGIIKAFEYTYELAWNTVKDFYESKGETDIQGSKDAFRLAFQRGLVQDGKYLMEAVKSRQLTTHTYNESFADKIFSYIKNRYYDVFKELADSLENEKRKEI
jgi:nucleotidyltransferase substrate binding protein (TIGR01987 family)